METEIIISKRCRNNSLKVHQCLIKEFSATTANNFLDRLEQRIEFIAAHPTAGRLSLKRKNVRSILFTPYNQIFYRYKIKLKCLSFLI
jgi:plasmid stabilization system protein ParE